MRKSISVILCIVLLSALTGCGYKDVLNETQLEVMNSNIKTERLLSLNSESQGSMDELLVLLKNKATLRDISINEIKNYLSQRNYEDTLLVLETLFTKIANNEIDGDLEISVSESYVFIDSENENIVQLVRIDVDMSRSIYFYFMWENNKIVNIEYTIV